MARVTVEECLKVIGNNSHFDLVLLAAEVDKQRSSGKKTLIQKKGIKTHVTALREIEEQVTPVSTIRKQIADRINHVKESEEQEMIDGESGGILEELQNSDFIAGDVEELHKDTTVFEGEEELFGENEEAEDIVDLEIEEDEDFLSDDEDENKKEK